MKKRSLWKMFLLEIVTLGIYRLYYFIKTRREMMDRDLSIKIMSPSILLASVAIVIGAIVVLFITIASSPNPQYCGGQPVPDYNSSSLSGTSEVPVTTNVQQQEPCIASNPVRPTQIASLIFSYLAVMVGAALFIVWEWSYSHGVDKVTDEKLGFALALIVLILVPDGIDILIIQDYFNNLPEPAPHDHHTHHTPHSDVHSPVHAG